MKNKVEIIMLPTENKTDVIEVTMGNLKELRYVPTLLLENLDTDDYRLRSYQHYQHIYITVSQDVEPIKEGDWMMYIRQDGSGMFPTIFSPSLDTLKNNTDRKIIATDDPNLKIADFPELENTAYRSLPQVQQSFLKEFVANPDGEWEVEYNEACCKCDTLEKELECPYSVGDIEGTCNAPNLNNDFYGLRLKLNQDNTINITPVKEKMIPLSKVKKLLEDSNHLSYIQGVDIGKGSKINRNSFILEDWIKENL